MKPTEILSKNTEAVADSLYTMIQQELSPHSCSSYNGYLDPSDPTITITVDDRDRLVDWCYGLVERCQFSTETVASAMEMVDRFLSTPSNSANAARVCDEALRDRTMFQLVTVAALFVSVKINERLAMSSDELSAICGHSYTAKEIEDMEHTLLCGLSWRCYTPTAQQVGLSFLSLVFSQIDIPEAVWSFILDEMTYLIDLAVQDYYFSTRRRSTVALAAIINVMNDSCIKEYKHDFETILSLIVQCFKLDQADIIQAATRRLRSYADAADAAFTDREEEEVRDGDDEFGSIATDTDTDTDMTLTLTISTMLHFVSERSSWASSMQNFERLSETKVLRLQQFHLHRDSDADFER